MPLQTIPPDWIQAVCAVLRTEDTRKIEWTLGCRQRYEADFSYLEAWPSDVYAPLIKALSQPNATGCPKNMAKPAGTTWEFYFTFKSTLAYGKILLRPDRRSIVLFSAHKPLGPTLSCE